jgi:hypothetical protein
MLLGHVLDEVFKICLVELFEDGIECICSDNLVEMGDDFGVLVLFSH